MNSTLSLGLRNGTIHHIAYKAIVMISQNWNADDFIYELAAKLINGKRIVFLFWYFVFQNAFVLDRYVTLDSRYSIFIKCENVVWIYIWTKEFTWEKIKAQIEDEFRRNEMVKLASYVIYSIKLSKRIRSVDKMFRKRNFLLFFILSLDCCNAESCYEWMNGN